MSINRNSTIPNKFHSFDIDTSNWPTQHRFTSQLADNPDEFTESDWLNLIIPNLMKSGGSQEAIDNKMDEFLEIRRKLRGYDMLADIDSTKSTAEIEQIAKNLINNDTVRPNVAVLLSQTYSQMEVDLSAIRDDRNSRREDGRRGRSYLTYGYLGDKEQLGVPLLVTTFNALLCIYAELIVKEGTNYGQPKICLKELHLLLIIFQFLLELKKKNSNYICFLKLFIMTVNYINLLILT